MRTGQTFVIMVSMRQTLYPPYDEDVAEIIETISVADIVASWKSDFDIDVARLFEGVDTLLLLRARATGRLSFYPPVEGDAAFYQAMRAFDWYHPPHKEEFVAAAKWHRAGERVLDIGAGDAGFVRHMPRRLYRGLETDPQAAAAATAAGLDVLDWDMQTYLGSDWFEAAGLVTAFQVLEHVDAPQRFIDDMVSLACVSGRVAIGVPDAGSYVADLPDFMLNAPPHHLTWWTEETLGQAMAKAGLRICAVHRFGVEPWERQLWWMARFARLGRRSDAPRFGAQLRARKVGSFLASWALQKLPIPKDTRGSTLLMIGEKAG